MKALSVRQPWASLIAEGLKTMELRTWETNHRGEIAIHASKGDSTRDVYRLVDNECPGLKVFDWDNPFGAIIATAKIATIMRFGNEYTYSLHSHEHLCPIKSFEFVPFGWVLTDIQKLSEPIPANGRLGLWEWQG
jgi:hypothetical protein